ncbi:hypothetical protein [Microbacterium lacticum]
MEEIELVAADIEAAVRAGAGGVVIGALTPAGEAAGSRASTRRRALAAAPPGTTSPTRRSSSRR